MFFGCSNFNCDLSDWDVSSGTSFDYMFYNCISFNSNLNKWKFNKKCKSLKEMFMKCHNFNGDISDWDVSNIEDFTSLFDSCW